MIQNNTGNHVALDEEITYYTCEYCGKRIVHYEIKYEDDIYFCDECEEIHLEELEKNYYDL